MLPPNAKRIALRVTPAAERALRHGHPWLFESAIQHQSHQGQAGDLAVVFDAKRRFIAIGLYDPTSPIRVRILHHGAPTTLSAEWLAAQVATAAALRQALPTSGTTGYRLIYGEGDGLPGLIVDRYGETLVAKLYTAAWVPHLPVLLPALLAAQPAARIIVRFSRNMHSHPALLNGLRAGQALHGQPPSGAIPFEENGLHFAADVIHGHKTGFFFDHRENRQRVRQLAQGKRVLDLFAYAGGFSLYAAAGGATAVTSVDISAPALAEAQANFGRNAHLPGVAACQHTVLTADVFAALAQMQSAGQTFDMVIVDPPSFAKSQVEVERALAAYDKLTRAAVGVLEPQGLLVMASCSSRVADDSFFATVHAAAEGEERPLWEHKRTAHALDHPLRLAFPEGAYLKCLFATTID